MKKFAFGVLAVFMVVLLVVTLNGGFDDTGNKEIKFNEAAFSLPFGATGSKDSSSFLVGEFNGDDGSHLSFDGKGGLRRIGSDSMVANGSYELVQSSDGSAMISFTFGTAEEIYAFALCSEHGDFLLQDEDGNALNYTPVIN